MYQEDYNSNRLLDMVKLLGAMSQNDVKNIPSWGEIKNKLTGKVKTDDRTDKQIEKDTVDLYNKYFLEED